MFIALGNVIVIAPTLQLGTAQQHVEPSGKPSKKLLTGSADMLITDSFCSLIPLMQTTPPHSWKKWETTVGNSHATIVAVVRSTALTRWNYPTSNCYMWWSHLVSISCQISFSPSFSSFDLLCSMYWRFKKVINLWLHDDLQPHFSFVLVWFGFFFIGHFQALTVLCNSRLFRWVFWMKYLGK